MNVTKCINGHFFDADKYQLCPHCGAVAPTGTEETATESKKPHVSFLGKKKKEVNTGSIVEMPDKTIGKTFGVFGTDEDKKKTEVESEGDITGKIKECSLCGKAYDSSLYTDCPNCACQRLVPIIKENQKNEAEHKGVPIATHTCPQCNQTYNQFHIEDEGCPYCGYKPQKNNNIANEEETEPLPLDLIRCSKCNRTYSLPTANGCPYCGYEEKGETLTLGESKEPLKDAIKKAISSNEGKTIGFFHAGNTENNAVSNEPVVGWLVCIKGNHFGESFNIFAGRNSIGRGESNMINIARDDAVSRSKHAWLTYEPKKRNFYIQPGEGSGLTYLNGDNVMESKKLSAKDVLEFGNGQYMLIPLCGDDFTWEDYLDKE